MYKFDAGRVKWELLCHCHCQKIILKLSPSFKGNVYPHLNMALAIYKRLSTFHNFR